jgi:hypothetical protein
LIVGVLFSEDRGALGIDQDIGLSIDGGRWWRDQRWGSPFGVEEGGSEQQEPKGENKVKSMHRGCSP